ncbi:MAG: transglutaminase domain-containing protein [archaeon]|nr:transglutaminase domain-containing protein [archaeon]MDD2477967.1 transglutaminase domain-containing protein [Candidatus ainarchaeum sp.]MDD3084961.1 transglutaminase domain-containing protein [Candidatus ainarchaeum sp.]MDD4221403.1 transglutaminase domain-containing protein [Candidatus ainarchaeum sp.]MDD4662957.1 transglutaminase domain-containing protein [Candidatus ainarchaeum sp.]
MLYKKILLIILLLLIIPLSISAETTNNLNFDAIKGKVIDVDINIEYPIIINSYKEGNYLNFKMAVPYSSRNQKSTTSAYYYNDLNQKVFAEIEEDKFGNSIAVFNISKIEKNKYIFYVNSNIKSENNIIFSKNEYYLSNDINEFVDYKLPTKNMQSDKSEIISLANSISRSDNALEEIVNITNWVHQNIEYDLAYGESVEDSLTVLSNRAGVCDELANLAGALLRARGFPVKYISGFANSTLSWQPHAWLEVYVPGQDWIPVDPTYGEVGLVDASHIVVSKSYDASDIKDIVTTTNTVDISFGEKNNSFLINDQRSYSDNGYANVLNINLVSEKKYKQNSAFTIKVKVKNTNVNPITNLLILKTNDNFTQIYPKYNEVIIYLGPLEEKEIIYYYILPKTEVPVSYPYILATQFKDFEGSVNVYPDQGLYEDAFFILDPIFYFKDNSLFMEQDIINHTLENKNLIFDFNINNEVSNQTVDIEPNKIINFEKEIGSFLEGFFSYKISGDYDYENKITIYSDKIVVDENYEKENLVVGNNQNLPVEDGNDVWKDFKEEIEDASDKPKINNILIYIIIGVFFIIIFLIIILKPKKPEKPKEEIIKQKIHNSLKNNYYNDSFVISDNPNK